MVGLRLWILAVGHARGSSEGALCDDFIERARKMGRNLGFPAVAIEEVPVSKARETEKRIADECERLAARVPDGAHVILLDAKGKGMTSDDFAEMLALFESETRARLARLAAGITDARTLLREVHTLKGAAGTVCAARLAARAAVIEARVQAGGTLADGDLPVLTAEFEVWLEAVRALSPGAAQLA